MALAMGGRESLDLLSLHVSLSLFMSPNGRMPEGDIYIYLLLSNSSNSSSGSITTSY